MIKEFLKIAGVKNEEQFYKKYPSEAAFYKAHPEAKHLKSFKKGGEMKKLEQLTDFGNPPEAQYGIGLNAQGVGLGANPPGGFDWNVGYGGISGVSAPPQPPGGIAPGMYEVSDFDRAGIQKDIQDTMNKKSKKPGILDKLGGPMGVAGIANSVIGGIRGLQDEKKSLEEAETAEKVSGLTLQAARSRPKEPLRRYYNRPEDMLINPEELFPTYGVGSSVLSSAQDGATIGGNPTEIQNTYNPGDLYSNLGYEPMDESSIYGSKIKDYEMDESDIVKRYVHGGGIPRAAGGFMGVLGDIAGSSFGQQIPGLFSELGSQGAPNAGSNLGQTLGTAAGTIFGGPVGSMIGGALGGLVGGALDPRVRRAKAAQERTRQNLTTAAFESGMQGLQGQYASYMKDGGSVNSDYEWISHTWQPQVITKFGNVDVSQLHSIATDGMDTLRTGGRITQNNMYPQNQFNFGGQLQTTWGGYAEPISHNPYLPGTGETVMFRGNSHEESDKKGRTGIGVKYGNDGDYSPYMEYGRDGIEDVTDVEVERGEPATELQDSTGDTSMVVFGNLKVPNQFLGDIGDPNAKGKKFKHYAKDLSKKEAKQNKIIDKATQLIEIHDDGTPFSQLAIASAKAMIDGAHLNLQKIAQFKQNAATVQNSINDTAEEYGIDADALAKGKIKVDKEAMQEQARFGKEIKKAARGMTTGPTTTKPINPADYGEYVTPERQQELARMYDAAKAAKDTPQEAALTEAFQKEFHKSFPKTAEAIIKNDPGITAKAKSKGVRNKADLLTRNQEFILDTNVDGFFGDRTVQYNAIAQSTPPPPPPPPPPPIIPEKEKDKTPPPLTTTTTTTKPNWWDAVGSVVSNLRRPYDMGFDAAQLYPEMMALSMNVLEPVKAQGVQPLLEIPYDISLQDQLNEITADQRAAQRMSGGDPSALANIAAQSQAAKQKVLGEQFRANQAMKAGVYGRNRQALNQAQLQNLQIYADQEQKQQMAKANTKATALAAMESMSDKIAKNKLENRTLAAMQNFFPNYRIGPNMQITPTGLTFFPGVSVGSGATPETTTTKETTKTAKKGKLIKKSNFNGSIVKALKNI